jgi:hypothetical protein
MLSVKITHKNGTVEDIAASEVREREDGALVVMKKDGFSFTVIHEKNVGAVKVSFDFSPKKG